MKSLPICRASELEPAQEERRWLIEGLWTDQAVGILGGEPKCCKSFLALDVAVSVASGAPCLRRFTTAQTGPVLLFAAEDPLHVVRRRLEGIASAAGVAFNTLDIHVITVPVVRLDLEEDRRKLTATVGILRPKLLILDPFVRLHRADENVASEVAPLLGYLRHLERSFGTAVLLVHHSRKGASHVRAGQALRGSSELHAWGDSNLYVRRRGEALFLSVEHRAAPSIGDFAVELRPDGDALALHVQDVQPDDPAVANATASVADRIEDALGQASGPVPLHDLRKSCRIRMATLCDVLTDLTAEGRVVKSTEGYQLADA